MHLLSKLATRIRYNLSGSEYLLKPGDNPVTGDELRKLRVNDGFKKHTKGGFVVVRDEPDATASVDAPAALGEADDNAARVEATHANEPPPTAGEVHDNVRERKPGESKRDFDKRVKALDAAEEAARMAPAEDHAKLFADWDQLTQDERDGLFPTLSEAEQAAIQARGPNTGDAA